MGRTLHTEIKIAAPAERVWEILADFDAYPRWNPLLKGMRGVPTVGSRIRISVRLAWWFRMIIHPVVLHVEATRDLRWKGSLIIPGLFAGVHAFEIQRLGDDRSRLIQSETFSGLLVPFILVFLFGLMRRGLEAMNVALKNIAEAS